MIGSHLSKSTLAKSKNISWTPGPTVGAGGNIKQRDQDLTIRPPSLQESFTPMAIMLMGPRGQGKTLAMTTLGRLLTYAYRDAGFHHCRTFSNYPSTAVDVADGFLVDRLTDPRDRSIHDGILLIDEVQSLGASTKWNSNINFGLNQFLVQIRKDRLEIVFTTQYPRGLDRGVLEQIDLFVECRKIGDGYGVAFAIHDWKAQFTPPKRKRPWPPFWHEADWYHAWFGVKNTYGHYPEQAHIIPRYWQDTFGDATQDEWRRLGYQLEGVNTDDDDIIGQEAWSAAYSNRSEDLQVDEWIDIVRFAGVFEVATMYKDLKPILPPEIKNVNLFIELLKRNDFTVDGKFAQRN